MRRFSVMHAAAAFAVAACGLAAPSVSAAPPGVALVIVTQGSGGGTVSSAPGSIDCPGKCAGSFAGGASVTLTASPDPSSYFDGWKGGCSGDSLTCTIRLDLPASVVAVFVKPFVQAAKARFAGNTLVVTGTANVDAVVTATVMRPGTPSVDLPLRVTSGSFSSTAQLPPSLPPGAYTVAVGGRVRGMFVAPTEIHGVVLKPSPVGVVGAAYFSLTPDGKKVSRLPHDAKQLWVHMAFMSLPKGSPHLTVEWTKPDGTPATVKPATVRLHKTIVTGIAITRAADKGVWTVVLRNGKSIVFQTNIEAG